MKKLQQLFGILVCLPVLALAQAVAPVCTPTAGTYATTVSVTCSTTTSGADIFYTLDGSTPTPESTKYTGPLTVSATTTVKTIAAVAGIRQNNIQNNNPSSSGTFWKAPDYADGGGSGTPTGLVHVSGISSPSLSGASMEFSQTAQTGHQTNTLWAIGTNFGKCDTCTYQLFDYQLDMAANVCSSNGTTEQDDAKVASSLGNLRYMGGAQWRRSGGCTSGHACLDIAGNSNVPWTFTGVNISLACGTFHHMQRAEHFVPSEVTSKPCTDENGAHWPYVYQDYWIVDGTRYDNSGAGWKFCANSVNWPSWEWPQFQFDATTGTQTMYLDDANFVAYLPGSSVSSNAYTITGGSGTPTGTTPSISPPGGFYGTPQSVIITDTTPGAAIHYTTDGTTPTSASTTYSSALSISTNTTVKAIAVASGYLNSSVASAVFSFTGSSGLTPTPTFSPAGGSYTSSQYVTLADSLSGSVIYYTTDGSTPTTASNVYSVPLTLAATATVKAMAASPGNTNSSVASATYSIIATLTAGAPTFSPGTGNYAGTQTVAITCPAGGTCYYTTDGSTPTTSSTVYSTPISITVTTTVKAIAAISGETNSAVGAATYTIGCGLTPYATGNVDPAQIKPTGRQGAGALIQYAAGGFTAGLPALYDCNGNVVSGSNYAADTGSANAYAVTLSPAPTIVAGSYLAFKAANANTGASTIAINGGSATAIKKQGTTALASGDIPAGGVETLINDGTNWQLLNPPGSSSGGGPTLQTNGTPNGSQTLLDLKAGTGMTVADDGIGGVTLSSSGGGGASPTTITPSGASSATVTSCITSSYRDYEIRISDVVFSTAGATLTMQFSTDNGSTWDTGSNYQMDGAYTGIDSSAGGTLGTTTGTAWSVLWLGSNASTNAGASNSTRYTLFNPLNASRHKFMTGTSVQFQSSDNHWYFMQMGFRYANTNAVNAMKFIASSGTFSGTIVCQPLPQ